MPFEPTGQGNLVLEGDGFFISYRQHSNEENNPISEMCAALATAISGETYSNDLAETALCRSGSSAYFILNGDFRKQYKSLVGDGWEACYQFWLSEVAKGNKSQWSHNPIEIDLPTTSVN